MSAPEEIIIERAAKKERDAVIKYLNHRIAALDKDGPPDDLDNMGTTRWAIYYAAKAELRAAIKQLKQNIHHNDN